MTRPLLALAAVLLLPFPVPIPIHATDAPEPMTTARGGIGVILSMRSADLGTVVRVFPNGPAAQAGIEAGDKIVRVDGKAVADLNAADSGKGAALAIQGEPGTSVAIVVVHQGTERALSLQRKLLGSFIPPPSPAPGPAP